MSGQTVMRWQLPTLARYPVPRAVQFIDRARFMALAERAYDVAARELIPPNGEQWAIADLEGVWSGPADFFDGICHHVAEGLRFAAIEGGHLVEVPCLDGEAA